MSVADQPPIATLPLPATPRKRPRVKKLRLLLILAGVTVLAVISTVFGMMMAVASDLPALESLPQYRSAKNSVMVDDQGRRLGLLVSNQNRILVNYDQISSWMKRAIIAIEDKRFYSHSGVDIRGIARAFVSDITKQGGTQGGSTIPQQFVKVALKAQSKRTVFEKLREAALAYHLSRKWSKEKILTEYLNAIYFGNGAYGIESAARTYFGADHPGCGTPGHEMCAKLLTAPEAALIAGIVQNPSGYDPVSRPTAAQTRRNVVLRAMLDQGYISRAQYDEGRLESIPSPTQPNDDSKAPYFTSWVRQQLVDKYSAREAFEGGLTVRTTLDLDLQTKAQEAIDRYLNASGMPSAALVAIDNDTGGVRAMVGGGARTGAQFADSPFNLATQGQRQPGSSFKPFVLATALSEGIPTTSVWNSHKLTWILKGGEVFTVKNSEGAYTGPTTLANATINSDNTVFVQVGKAAGYKNIARTARKMGIRSTKVSTNPAMAIGGLNPGVTVLDMAHAYTTIANGGTRVQGTLGAGVDPTGPDGGPVGILSVTRPNGKEDRNHRVTHDVVSPSVIASMVPLLQGVVTRGTGKRAQIAGLTVAGKTGTTDNYVDAWFVGFTDRLTVAVWVGYPDSAKPMKTQFYGDPVLGGTYPAQIWRDFMVGAEGIFKTRTDARLAKEAAAKEKRDAAARAKTQSTVTDTSTATETQTGTSTVGTETSGGATSTTQSTSTTGTSDGHQQSTTPSQSPTPGVTTTPASSGPAIGGSATPTAPTTPETGTPQAPASTTPTVTPPDASGGTGGAGATGGAGPG